MTTLKDRLLTAEEYGELPDLGRPTELVRGVIVDMNMPYPRHGEICLQIGYLIKRFLEDNSLGIAVGNDSGVITERDPDSVRGPDVAFYSYEDVPRGPLPCKQYLSVVPRLAFEVLSPSDRWSEVQEKVAEFLQAGVRLVAVVDPAELLVYLYRKDKPEQVLTEADAFEAPDVLPGFRVPVQRFFE